MAWNSLPFSLLHFLCANTFQPIQLNETEVGCQPMGERHCHHLSQNKSQMYFLSQSVCTSPAYLVGQAHSFLCLDLLLGWGFCLFVCFVTPNPSLPLPNPASFKTHLFICVVSNPGQTAAKFSGIPHSLPVTGYAWHTLPPMLNFLAKEFSCPFPRGSSL